MKRMFYFCAVFASIAFSAQAMAASYIYTMHASTFMPNSSDTQYASNGLSVRVTGGGVGYFDAPAFLPNGAEITGVTGIFLDNDNSAEIEYTFTRYKTDGVSFTTLDDLNSGIVTAIPNVQNVSSNFTEPYPIVNNADYFYVVDVTLPQDTGSSMLFYGYQIHYTLDTQRNVVVIPMGQ